MCMGILIKNKNKLLISISLVIFTAFCFFNYNSRVEAATCDYYGGGAGGGYAGGYGECARVIFEGYKQTIQRGVRIGTTVGTLPTASQAGAGNKTGYTFKGWYTKENGGTEVTPSKIVYYSPTYFYAQWNQIHYNLIMRANNGNPSRKEVRLDYETEYKLSKFTPTRAGYAVNGWHNSNTDKTYSPTATVSKLGTNNNQNIYLDVIWKQISYNLILVYNDGTGGSLTKQLQYESSYQLPTKSRTGYTLSSWKNNETGRTYSPTSYVSKLGTTQGQKVYLHAQWTAHTYSIEFNGNSGTATTPMTTLTNRLYGKVYTEGLPANKYKKEDYIFIGWNNKPDGSGNIRLSDKQQYSNLTPINGEKITLYAQWEKAEEFTISYDLSGGGVSEFNKASYSSTSAPITLHNPTKEGYNFIGWTGSNGDDPQMEVTIPTGSSGNKEFVANYKAKTYELEFLDADGGTKKIEGEFGAEINGIPTSSKKGYTFVAWVDEEGNLIGDLVPLGNKKYYAAFRPNRYTITFKANGGKGSMDEQEFVYDQADKLNKNEFTKDKYVFVGWNTKEDGSGNTYSDEGEILNLTDKDKDGIVLYAIWEDAAASKKAKNPKTGAYVSIAIVSVLLVIGAASYLIAKKKINIQKV